MPPPPSAAPAWAGLRNPVGTHVKVGGGLVKGALATADAIGAEVVQVFVGNPRGWASSPGDPAVDAAFRAANEASGRRVGDPHALPGEPRVADPVDVPAIGGDRRAQPAAGRGDRRRGRGRPHRLVRRRRHPGRRRSPRCARGCCRCSTSIGSDGPSLLLEPTAGQGRSLCAGVDDLERYLAVLDGHPAVGICLDTCHVFAAGAPLDEPGGTTATVDRLVEIGGPGRLRLVHANDSMDVRGAFKDRHQKLGEGHIGLGAFEELLAHPATAGVPFVLETPGSRDVDDPQIELLKKLRDA